MYLTSLSSLVHIMACHWFGIFIEDWNSNGSLVSYSSLVQIRTFHCFVFYIIRSNNDSVTDFASQIWEVIIRTNNKNNDTSTPHWGAIEWLHIGVMASLIASNSTADSSSKIKYQRFALLANCEGNPSVTTKNQLCRKLFHAITSELTPAVTHHNIITAIPCLNEPETTNTQ